jgi:hypothetical protein
MAFGGYPALTPRLIDLMDGYASDDATSQAVDYRRERTLTGKTYKAAALVHLLVMLDVLPAELRPVAEHLNIR